jgi:hypothetical protein
MWKDFLLNCFSQGSIFFPRLGDIKWCHAKVSHFSFFFWISYVQFGTAWTETRFRHSGNGKYTFHETNQKSASCFPSQYQKSLFLIFLNFFWFFEFFEIFKKIANFLIFPKILTNTYTHTHTYIHIYIHIHIHTYIYTYTYACTYLHCTHMA